MLVTMDDDEYDELSEVEKSIDVWRQSERKVMIDTIQDLIQTSHKYAKSQYTPSSQRVRWTLLAGKFIWYKDQILKSFSLEALTIEMNELKKQMIEDEQRRERDSLTRNYPLIGFRKLGDRKREDQEGVSDGEAKAGEAEEPKVTVENEEESVAAD